MSPPLRASNEHILIVRVPRAQGTHRAIPLLLFSILLMSGDGVREAFDAAVAIG
jgi:hypothetical protein